VARGMRVIPGIPCTGEEVAGVVANRSQVIGVTARVDGFGYEGVLDCASGGLLGAVHTLLWLRFSEDRAAMCC
jgi:hypothetical protein